MDAKEFSVQIVETGVKDISAVVFIVPSLKRMGSMGYEIIPGDNLATVHG